MKKPYLIFDAGGTLVFPDFKYLASVANGFGININEDQLFSIHCDLIFDLDVQTLKQNHLVDPFPNGYTDTLFKGLIPNHKTRAEITNTIASRHQKRSIWTATYPWVYDALKVLYDSGYSMSVVSNSDGRADQILIDLNLKIYFEQVFDSEIIGFSKPDTRLFKHALCNLNLHPEDVIYIGDVYFIDVWGANQAGIGGIHLDPRNLYGKWPGIHLPSVTHLFGFLENYYNDPSGYDLYPAKECSIQY